MKVVEGKRKSMRLSMGKDLYDVNGPLYTFKITEKPANITEATISQNGILVFSVPSGAGETFSLKVTATDKSSNATGSVTLNFQTVAVDSNVTARTIIKTGANDGGSGLDRTFAKDANFNVAGVNGLVWADKSRNVPTDVTGKTYQEAKDYCEVTLSGIDGGNWRLPTINELLDTVNYGKVVNSGTKVYDAFETELLTSWSEKLNNREYYLHNVAATIIENNNQNKFMTRCVQGEKETADHLVYIGDIKGDTFDLSTGLQWSPAKMMQVAGDVAKDYCEASTHNGVTGWRLPNINELRSVVENGSVSSFITTGTQLISGTPYNDGNESTSINWGIWLNADVTASVAAMYTIDPNKDNTLDYQVTCVRDIN